MNDFYLGFVEKIGPAKPEARLHPIAQASNDKKRWSDLTQAFPNSNVVSWWAVPADLRMGSYWIFQIEDSPSYKPEIKQHDEFRVKANEAQPAIQVLTLADAKDEEDIRRILVNEGIPADLCVTKHVVVSTASGNYLGPIKLTLKEGRAFIDSHDLDHPIALQEFRQPTTHALTSKNLVILPPLAPLMIFKKIGELDFSADEVFLKRALKDLKAAAPNSIGDAKLTKGLIDIYTRSFLDKKLSPLEQHRILRLKALSQTVTIGIDCIEECLSAMQSWEPVRRGLDLAKKEAVTKALSEAHDEIGKLTQATDDLNAKNDKLTAELKALDERTVVERRKQNDVLKDFEDSVKTKFHTVEKDAADFLASIPLLKAAMRVLGDEGHTRTEAVSIGPQVFDTVRITNTELVPRLQANILGAGLDWWTSASLTSVLTAGFVPILRGPQAGDTLAALGATIAGNRLFSLPLNSVQATPKDLLNCMTICDDRSYDGHAMSLKALLGHVRQTQGLFLLCLEGINLCQADALLLPLLKRYAHLQYRVSQSDDTPLRVMTPVGEWPQNLLIAGTIIDSPLALPVSKALWEVCALVASPIAFDPALPPYKVEVESKSAVTNMEFLAWRRFIQDIGQSSIRPAEMNRSVWALNNHCSREFSARTSALTKALPFLLSAASEQSRAILHLAISLVPYGLANALDLAPLIAGNSGATPQAKNLLESHQKLFRDWGLESN